MFELLGNVVTESALTAEENAFMENYSTGWECKYNDANDAILYAAMESEQNFNAIMQATMVQEASYFMNNGVEMVYEAVDFKAFFGKIKAFVLKAWEKIKAIFKKVFDTIAGWVSSDKKYLEKNGKAMKEADGTPIDYKGYDVDFTDLISEVLDVAGTYDNYDYILSKDFNAEDIQKDVIGAIAGGSASTREDYIKYAREKLKIDEKTTIKKYDADDCIATIREAKGTKKFVKLEYDATKKLFSSMASSCDMAAKKAAIGADKEDAKKLNKASGAFSKAMSQCTNLAHDALNQEIKAINIQYREAKAMTVKALAEKAKEKAGSKNESFSFGLDSVELI